MERDLTNHKSIIKTERRTHSKSPPNTKVVSFHLSDYADDKVSLDNESAVQESSDPSYDIDLPDPLYRTSEGNAKDYYGHLRFKCKMCRDYKLEKSYPDGKRAHRCKGCVKVLRKEAEAESKNKNK